MLNSCSSMHVKSQSCIVLFGLLLQQLYGILGQPSYLCLVTGKHVLHICNMRTTKAQISYMRPRSWISKFDVCYTASVTALADFI